MSNVTSQSTSAYVSRMGKCPTCARDVELFPQLDGLNRQMPEKPWRWSVHAGTQWGRQCPNSGELQS